MKKFIRVIELDGLEREALLEIKKDNRIYLVGCRFSNDGAEEYFDGYTDGLQKSGQGFLLSIVACTKIGDSIAFEKGDFTIIGDTLLVGKQVIGKPNFFKKSTPLIHFIRVSQDDWHVFFKVDGGIVKEVLSGNTHDYPMIQAEGFMDCASDLGIEHTFTHVDLDYFEESPFDLSTSSVDAKFKNGSLYIRDIVIAELE